MRGAHCLVCLERGPDLTLDASRLDPEVLARGPVAVLVFSCGTCGGRWRWLATWTGAAWSYGGAVLVVEEEIRYARPH